MKAKKGFKVTDANMQCRGFQFELKKEFRHEGEIKLCSSGFHFCKKLVKCFDYYDFNPKNRVFEIEYGKAFGDEDDKMVTDSIIFIRELSWLEVIEGVNIGIGNSGNSNSGNRNSGNRNSGNRNSGDWNSGNRNSGNWNSGDWNSSDRNSGNWNSGEWNSGYRNSGYWNSGDRNSGYLNSDNAKLRIFNKETDIPLGDIEFPEWLYFELSEWCDYDYMTDEEKALNPNAEIAGGYLKVLDYKEAAQASYSNASKDDQDLIENLPNYDADVLYEIFGIDRRNK